MISLCFGRAVMWGGQNRDAYGLSWATALAGLWPQTLFGAALLAVLWTQAPGAIVWASLLLAGFLLSIPFAVVTASPAAGAALARAGLCAIPEEFDTPPELAALAAQDEDAGGPKPVAPSRMAA
jgi:membrane glycosyltransferase